MFRRWKNLDQFNKNLIKYSCMFLVNLYITFKIVALIWLWCDYIWFPYLHPYWHTFAMYVWYNICVPAYTFIVSLL